MTTADILRLLQPHISDGILTLATPTGLGGTRLDPFLTNFFGGTLRAAVGTPETLDASVIFSSVELNTAGSIFNRKRGTVRATLTFTGAGAGADSGIDLAIQAVIPDGYALQESFPALQESAAQLLCTLAIDAAAFTIDSSKPPLTGDLRLTLSNTSGPTSQIAALLGNTLELEGTFGLNRHENLPDWLPVITLKSATRPQLAIGGFELDATLQIQTALAVIRQDPSSSAGAGGSDGGNPMLLGQIVLTTALVTPALTLPVRMQITEPDQRRFLLTLNSTAQSQQIDGLGALSGFLGGNAPTLSAGTPIGTLSLDSLSVVFDATSRSFSNLEISVGLGTDWTIIDDVLELKRLQARLTVPTLYPGLNTLPITFGLAVGATIELGDAILVATVLYPDETVSIALDTSTVLDIDKFLAKLAHGARLPGDNDLQIVELDALADIGRGAYQLSCVADGQLSVIPKMVLSSIDFALEYENGGLASFNFGADFTIGGVPLYIAANYAGGAWSFDGGSQTGESVDLARLIVDIADIFGCDLTNTLPAIVLSQLSLTYETAAGSFGCSASIAQVDTGDPILQKIGGSVKIQYSGAPTKSWTGDINGVIAVGSDQTITADLSFEKATVLSLKWEGIGGRTLGIGDLCRLVDLSPPEIPAGLDFALAQIEGSYDISGRILVLAARSTVWGTAQLIIWHDATAGWSLYFTLATQISIGLTNLPIVGGTIAQFGQLSLDDIQFVVSMPPLTAAQAATLIPRIPAGYPVPDPAGLPGEVSVRLDFNANGSKTPLIIGTGKAAATPQLRQLTSAAAAERPTVLPATLTGAGSPGIPGAGSGAPGDGTPRAPSDGTKWFAIQKSIGPLSIQRVGIRCDTSQLTALLDASVDAGGLTIALQGFGMEAELKSLSAKFIASGIDITLAEGPVLASGGLSGSFDPVDLYGEITFQTPEFALSALAGFAVVEQHPSFLLYATLLDPPLGGPVFFFVTGLAAGVGFNRKLVIPSVDRVAQFPFIEWAMGSGTPSSVANGSASKQITDVMATLVESGVVAPQIGSYWLAAGVHFTSFELVDSFALLTASLGADLEIDLLGLSVLTLPPQTRDNPVVLVEIELKASFSPAAGLLAINGQLSPNSYVLSKDCHLTGGFAYYCWFSGEHEGDFVLTLGGYSPRFTLPAHYPVVQRLGLRWRVTDQLTISGDEYFALTSTAVMAGGGLSAVWDGGPVSAWFSVEADFLLIYQPFHYYLTAICQLGASFSIDLLFTTVTVTIHVGVGIELWGPDFAGVATVDLSIISFTIRFGGGDPQTERTITWEQFVARLLPKAKAQGAAPAVTPAVVQIKVTQGLLKTLDETDDQSLNYIVDGQHFQMEVSAVIPSKDWEFTQTRTPGSHYIPASIDLPEALQPRDASGNLIDDNRAFGVGPVGIGSEANAFTATLSVQIDSTEDARLHAIRILKNVPKSLWQKPEFSADGNAVPQLDPLNDTTIRNVLVGFQLVPFVAAPGQTRPVILQYLQTTTDEQGIQYFDWSRPLVPAAAAFPGVSVAATIDGAASKNRVRVLEALRTAGLAVSQSIDVGELDDPKKTYLDAPPVLVALGGRAANEGAVQ